MISSRHRLVLSLTAAAVIACVAATPVLASGSEEQDALDEVVIGFQSIPNGEIVAKNLGWHEESFEVPVRWVQFNSGSELNSAIAAGSVHLGLGGSSTTVAAIAQGVPAQVIWIYDIIGDNEALVVRDGAGIESVEDLEGRRVGVPFGATTHYHLLVALRLFDVDPSTVTVMDLAPSDMRAAWQRGDIDAGFVWEPTLAAMLDMDGEVLISSREIAEEGFPTGDIGIVHERFGEQHPDVVVQYLRNQIRAVELIRDDPERAARAVAEEFELADEEALRQMSTLVFLDGDQQLGPEYLGTAEASGAFAEVFLETARFLEEQDTISSAPELEVFEQAIHTGFLEQAVDGRGE
ncbi:MAG: ABC transporter substrate-binding protein [Spirochaetota bacterium]